MRLAAALLFAAQAQGAADCTGHLCGIEALRPFFARVEARQGPGPVHILQLGDSHTAGDTITQPLRRALQARYGDGGRGVLPPGRPYPGFLTWRVTASQSGPWSANASFGPGYAAASGRPIGIAGYTQTAAAAGASLGIRADSPMDRFDTMIVCALREPGAGNLRLRIGTKEEIWHLGSAERRGECRTLDADGLAEAAWVSTADARPVSITSFATFRGPGGIALSNLGVSGSQLVHLARQNERVVAAELGFYRPDLLILAFGTNEGFSPVFDEARYEADLRARIARIRRLAGRDVPILLLGPPDAAARGRSGRPCGNGASVPAPLERVRDIQRSTARALGLAFWDWSAAMGGPCASAAWAARGAMRGDLVHFTQSGGEEIARLLFRDVTYADAAARGEGR
jgi:lysophospholipase L1-like esterase